MKTTPRSLSLLIAALLVLVSPVLWAQEATDTTVTETVTGTVEPTTTEETTTYFEEDDDDRDDVLACGICGGIGLVFVILPLLISVGIAWWIYKDATRAGNPQAVLWAVLGFFFNIIGLIIYLIARPKGPPATTPPAA